MEKEHSKDYTDIIEKLKRKRRNKKLYKLIAPIILFSVSLTLSLIYYDWKLILIILLFLWGNNIKDMKV